MMAAPIWQNKNVIGLLEVFSPTAKSFGLNDQKVLERLAEMIVISLDHTPSVEPSSAATTGPVTEPKPPIGSVPTLEMLPVAEPSQPRTQPSIEIGRLLESETSSPRKIMVVTLAVASLIVLIWLVLAWATSRETGSHGLQPARQNIAKNAASGITPTDLDKLRKLADDGDPNAQFDLGARYATGEDVKQDYSESVRWFTLAAEQDHVIAQATLGAYYWAGRGMPQDLSKAYFWSTIAQAGGDEASKYRVAVLASRMTPEQVTAAQRQAREWIKKHQPAGQTSR